MSERERERVHRRLRGAVDRHAGHRRKTQPRRHIHDRGTRLLAQVGNEQHREVNRRFKVDRDLLRNALPLLGLAQLGAKLDAGVVDEHVQTGELGDRPMEQRKTLRLAGEVAGMDLELGVLLLRLSEFFLAPAAEDDFAARRKKPLGQRESDSGCSSGDENGVRAQVHHVPLDSRRGEVRTRVILQPDAASSARYSTKERVAPSKPWIFGFEDSMT